MAKVFNKDMTQGNEAMHIIRFALPMLAGNLLQQLYNVVDTIIVGKYLGKDALAAVGATGSMTFLFYSISLGLAVGAGVIISQFYGAGLIERVKSAIFNSAIVTAVLSAIMSIVSVILTRPMLTLLGTPDKILNSSVGYMQIACAGTIAVAAYNWINSVMRCLGDSKTPLFFLGFASIMNVALDLLFVVKFSMGVNGAALATIIAQFFAALLSIIYGFNKNEIIKLKKEHIKYEREMAITCIKRGFPIAIQNSMISISMIALQRITNTFGETIMASYTVTMRIEQLIQQPFISLNSSLATFVGQNTGAQKPKRVIKGYHIGLKIEALLSLIVMSIFFIFGRHIVSLFVSDTEVINIGSTAIKITSCFFIFLGTIHTTRGFLNGAGDTSYAMVNGFVEVICRVIFSIILTRIPIIGYWGIWGTTCITWLVTAIISFLRYKHGAWQTKGLITAKS